MSDSTPSTRNVALTLAVQTKVEVDDLFSLAADIEAYLATGKIPE